MRVFDEMNRQFALDKAAEAVARELREPGYLDSLLGPDHAVDFYLKPEGQGDGFFSLVCALALNETAIKPAVAEMLMTLGNEMFTEQLVRRLDPMDVENIQGYLLDCEVFINGKPWVREP